MAKFTDLKFKRTYDLGLIPHRLWKAIKGQRYDMEMIQACGGYLMQDPLAYLFVLVDDSMIIKGFVWGQVSVLARVFHVNCLAVDQEYQDGTVIPKVIEYLTKEILDANPKLRRQLSFCTAHPKAFEKAGCKVMATIMEVDYDGKGQHSECDASSGNGTGGNGPPGQPNGDAPGADGPRAAV